MQHKDVKTGTVALYENWFFAQSKTYFGNNVKIYFLMFVDKCK